MKEENVMKKVFALALALIMALSLCACGGKEEEKEDVADISEIYSLDLTSTEVQPMSDERASMETLNETIHTWLDETLVFAGTEYEKLSYNDFADHIGADASEFYYDTDEEAEVYTWIAAENDSAKFAVWIADGTPTYAGAVNIH